MKLTRQELLEIVKCGCFYQGGNDCDGCPFNPVKLKIGDWVCCEDLSDYPDVVLKTASEAYRTNKEFAKVFDKGATNISPCYR